VIKNCKASRSKASRTLPFSFSFNALLREVPTKKTETVYEDFSGKLNFGGLDSQSGLAQ
jgi:hypothetical protein